MVGHELQMMRPGAIGLSVREIPHIIVRPPFVRYWRSMHVHDGRGSMLHVPEPSCHIAIYIDMHRLAMAKAATPMNAALSVTDLPFNTQY
jgi:hypothetical protein